MDDSDPYGHIAATKERLTENRAWVKRWVAGEGPADQGELHRRNVAIREDEEVLKELGIEDA